MNFSSMYSEMVPEIRFGFDYPKAISMLQYLLREVGGRYNYMSLLKLAFFADRFHIRKHARPISMDKYYAFKFGPAGSQLKDIIKQPDIFIDPPTQFNVEGYNILLLNNDINMGDFSKSDIVALTFSLEHFAPIGKRDEFTLSEISHAYPEWDQYATLFNSKQTSRQDIAYEDFLCDPLDDHPIFIRFRKIFQNPFPKMQPEQKAELIEEMREYSAP